MRTQTGFTHCLGWAFALTLGCSSNVKTSAGTATCATVEVLHSGVTVTNTGKDEGLRRTGRVEVSGRVQTAADGRAIVRTDDGLEMRVAGDSDIVFVDGRPRVQRGRVFIAAWGDDERVFGVAGDATIRIRDAALEVERGQPGSPATRVIAVRGEVSYQQGSRQGQLAQGESLEGADALAVRPAGVWDDWTGGAASPQGVAHRPSLGAGAMMAHLDPGEAPTPLAINEHKVNVVIRGDVAVTTVEQRFFNGSDRAAPVEYRLRMPEGAIVSGFRYEQNSVWMSSAPGAITSSVESGGTPALVGSGSGEVYAHLGFLQPGESVRAATTYVEWLTRDGAQRAYVYPLGDLVAPQIIGEFALDVDVTYAGARRVRAPEEARLQDGHVVMRRSDWRPRGDLVVDLTDDLPQLPRAIGWRGNRTTPEGFHHLMVDVALPPPDAQGTDLAVVLDDSAATNSASLEIARAAVDAILHQLGANDRAALFLGDLGARPVEGPAGQMSAVTPERREAILDAIAHTRPGGASDLGRMLAEAQGSLDPRRNGVVLYLGDATPTVGAIDPARLVDEVQRQAPDLRLYGITLGGDSHPEVLAPLAAQGGMIARVDDQSEAVATAHRLCAHALRPCLRDVSIDLGDRVAHPLPARFSTWVVGDPLRVIGELTTRDAPKEVRVRARVGTDVRTWTLPLKTRDAADAGDLPRRWAQARIDALSRTGSGRASIAELGARYGLVTPVSALVLGTTGGEVAPSYTVTASLWPTEWRGRRLPQLGIASSVGPRGVQSVLTGVEVPIAVDDESGWRPHHAGEGRGLGGQAALSAALGVAEPAARACVERKRALRPALGGSVTISATVDAQGRVTNAVVRYSSMGDGETENCIRRAVLGVVLPAPELLGATPGTVDHAFDFGAAPAGAGLAGRACPSTAQLSRPMRRVLWRERLNARGISADGALQVWSNAMARCELRWWEDRVALLELFLEVLTDPADVVRVRNGLSDPSAIEWMDAAIARRFGPGQVWNAYIARPVYIDWDALLTRLSSPTLTPQQKITILRAYLTVAPRDIDLRLRLMAVLEEAGQPRDARQLGERLRRDPLADARVRGLVGELLLRANDRTEALRTFTEIAEFAPYDPYARGKLGDLLLTYGWAAEAYHQYQTLVALRPGDPLPPVRLALAALASGHEDEGLRLLRRASEEAGADAVGRVVQSMLDGEVARVVAARPDDPAVRAWLRVASRIRASRDSELVVRWTHPDLGVELLSRANAETAFTSVGDAPAALGLRVWSPDTALQDTHLVVRAPVGVQGGRVAEARLQLLAAAENGTRMVEQTLRFDREHRAYGFVVRDGAFVAEPVAATEQPARTEVMY